MNGATRWFGDLRPPVRSRESPAPFIRALALPRSSPFPFLHTHIHAHTHIHIFSLPLFSIFSALSHYVSPVVYVVVAQVQARRRTMALAAVRSKFYAVPRRDEAKRNAVAEPGSRIDKRRAGVYCVCCLRPPQIQISSDSRTETTAGARTNDREPGKTRVLQIKARYGPSGIRMEILAQIWEF